MAAAGVASMQGFWRRSSSWRPSKTPRKAPLNQGEALEYCFKSNLEEVVSVQGIFIEHDYEVDTRLTHSNQQRAKRESSTRPIPPKLDKMTLAYVLNGNEPSPPPELPAVPKKCTPKRHLTQYTFYIPNNAPSRRRSPM